MSLPTPAEIDEGIRNLALTHEGRLLYRHLQMILMSPAPEGSGGALRQHEGRRSLARDLKRLMDEELAKLGTARDRPGDHDPDAPAIVKRAEPIARASGGTERRVQPYSDDSKPT